MFFLLPSVLTMMHLCIMLYTYWTTLARFSADLKPRAGGSKEVIPVLSPFFKLRWSGIYVLAKHLQKIHANPNVGLHFLHCIRIRQCHMLFSGSTLDQHIGQRQISTRLAFLSTC